MKYVKEILRGLLIGVAGIVPGVSGGTLAVSMGVYDQIIGAVSHLFRKPGQSVRTLFPYGVGMLVGIGGLAFVIETLFGNFPFATSMAFLGLILGGIPALLKRADFHTDGMKKYVALAPMLIRTASYCSFNSVSEISFPISFPNSTFTPVSKIA